MIFEVTIKWTNKSAADYWLLYWHFVNVCAHLGWKIWKHFHSSHVMWSADKQHNYRLRQSGAALTHFCRLTANWCGCVNCFIHSVPASRFTADHNHWVSKSTKLIETSRVVSEKLTSPNNSKILLTSGNPNIHYRIQNYPQRTIVKYFVTF
jgi:hypothetical protein